MAASPMDICTACAHTRESHPVKTLINGKVVEWAQCTGVANTGCAAKCQRFTAVGG